MDENLESLQTVLSRGTCPLNLTLACIFSFLPKGSSKLQLLLGPVPLNQ